MPNPSNEEINNPHERPEHIRLFMRNYQNYLALGGTINKEDYESILKKAETLKIRNSTDPSVECCIRQLENMARFSGIELHNEGVIPGSKIMLYVSVRVDFKNGGLQDHYTQLNDQRMFAEVLRILGDADSLKKLSQAYPHIFRNEEKTKRINGHPVEQ